MDPTTTTSPPENPHTITDDCSQQSNNNNTSRSCSHNINNLKSLVFKFAARMLPAHQSLIQRRFDDIFPHELIVPDHPPYSDMILTALWELKAEGGFTEEEISEYIKKEYLELPWAHTTILNHHLRDLHMKGRITIKQNRFYLCPSSVTKTIPTPTVCPSPMSSPYSSSQTSLCYSPTSSSTSFSCGSNYERPKRKRRRRRKNTVGRGGKTIGARGRGRGRGRSPKMIEVGQRGRSNGVIRRRKRRRLFEDSSSEESQSDDDDVESEHVTEEQNEVTVMEVEDRTKVITCQNVCGKWNENVEDRGESVRVRRSGRRKHNVRNEESQPCEEAKEGTREQGHRRKHCNVIWIGRGVRRLKEFERDILEDESDDEVAKIADDAAIEKDVEMIGSDAEEYKEKEVKVAINVMQTQPIKIQQSDIIKKEDDTSGEQVELQRQSKEQKSESTEDDQLQNQEVQMADGQDSVTMHCGEQVIVAGVGNFNGDTVTESIRPDEQHEKVNKLEEENHEVQMMQCEAQAMIACVGNLNDDTFREEIRPDERNKKGNKLEEENQEDEMLVEQDAVMMQSEAKAIVANVGNLYDDTVTEEIRHDEQLKNGNKLEEENHELVKQDVLMMQCEGQAIVAGVENVNNDTVTEQIQPEERHKKGNKVEEEIVEQDLMMIQCETQSIVAGVEKQYGDTVKEQIWPEESRKDNKSEKLIHPLEQCSERNGQDRQQNEEAESAEERTQQGERTEGNQTEIVPADGAEVQQNLEMHQSETQARLECVTQNESEEQQLASEKHQDGCTEENKSLLNEQQQRNVIEQVPPQGEVKVAEDELQQVQPHNVEEKDNEPVHDVSTGQQDFVITRPESEVEGEGEEHKTSEDQDQIGIQETIASDLRPQQEGLDNAVLQEDSEQSRPLRERLRSSFLKEETTPNTKNQLELVTPPVRRSQRNNKTAPEAVGITEKGPDHSKEQLQQSGRSRPSTRNSKMAEAEKSSNARKTRSSGL